MGKTFVLSVVDARSVPLLWSMARAPSLEIVMSSNSIIPQPASVSSFINFAISKRKTAGLMINGVLEAGLMRRPDHRAQHDLHAFEDRTVRDNQR